MGSPTDQVAFRAHNAHLFELDSEFYDAVIELCVVHEKYEECVRQLYELVESRHRPRMASLTNALVAATHLHDTALGDEIPKLVQLYRLAPTVQYYEALAAYCAMVRPGQSWATLLEALSTPIRDPGNILKSGVAGCRSANEVFHSNTYTDAHLVPRGDPGSQADHNPFGNSSGTGLMDRDASYDPNRFDNRNRVVMPTASTISWALLGLANNDNCTATGEALRMLDMAAGKGIALGYEQFTFALYFAAQKSTRQLAPGEEIFLFVREIVCERLPLMKVNMTPEMILFAVRALARVGTATAGISSSASSSSSSTISQQTQREQATKSLLAACASLALEIVSAAVDTTSASTSGNSGASSLALANHRSSVHFSSIFYELYQLLSRAGAMATFSSTMRNYVLSRGEPVHAWLLRSWLWCNSNAEKPNGGHLTTAEAVEFLMMNRNQSERQRSPGSDKMSARSRSGDVVDGDGAATSALTQELVMSLVLCRIKHGDMNSVSKSKPNLLRSLDSIVLDVDDDNDDDVVDEHGNGNQRSGDSSEVTLLDMIEYFSDLLSTNIGNQDTSQHQNQQHSAISEEKKLFVSLEESLQSILENDAENEIATSSGDIDSRKQMRQVDAEIERQKSLLRMVLPSARQSSNEYNACTLLANGILGLASATQSKLDLSPAATSRDESSGDDESTTTMMMLIGYAQIFAGLPTEIESSQATRKIIEDFHPTPSNLRDLRAKWTIDVYDTMLRRNGQRVERSKKVTSILPHAMQVQPFHDNLKH